MKKLGTQVQARKRTVNRDLTPRKGDARGGIIAVLSGLLRPQPAQPATVPLNTPRG